MSGRGASIAVLDQVSADSNQPIHLVELYLDAAATCYESP